MPFFPRRKPWESNYLHSFRNGDPMNTTDNTKPRVLVVEDEVLLQKYFSRLLSNMNIEFIITGSAIAAIAAMETHRFDFLICDLNLPDGNGRRVVDYFEKHNLGGKIIVTTGAVESERPPLHHALLQKPFSAEEFETLIRNALGPPAPLSGPSAK